MTEQQAHYHKDEHGVLVKCYHKCRNVLTDYAFWIGITVSYPLEHFLWERVPPFSWLIGLAH
jgi:hypothetical protein